MTLLVRRSNRAVLRNGVVDWVARALPGRFVLNASEGHSVFFWAPPATTLDLQGEFRRRRLISAGCEHRPVFTLYTQ